MFDDMYKFILTLFSPLIVCYCGEKINSELEKIHTSVYMNQWYTANKDGRQKVLMTLMATTQPMTLNYKKTLCVFDYKCYSKVIQGVYSYMTLMIKVFDPS